MNIIDLMKSSSSEATMNGQVAIKLETNKIKRRVENFIDEILDYINSETAYINRNMSYCTTPTTVLTDEQKKMLVKEIENNIKELPGKLDKEIKEIYGNNSSEEENKKDDEVAKVDTVVTKTIVPAPATNYFGY